MRNNLLHFQYTCPPHLRACPLVAFSEGDSEISLPAIFARWDCSASFRVRFSACELHASSLITFRKGASPSLPPVIRASSSCPTYASIASNSLVNFFELRVLNSYARQRRELLHLFYCCVIPCTINNKIPLSSPRSCAIPGMHMTMIRYQRRGRDLGVPSISN